MRILLSAYACEPAKGSEPGVGWNWALALVRRGHEVWVLTRSNNRASIEEAQAGLGEPCASRLHFLYHDLPRWAAWWKRGGRGVHLYYALWQRGIIGIARTAHLQHHFDVAHHLTFGVWRQPTLLHQLGVPCIFGPVGGGETAPWPLVLGMPNLWSRVSEFLRFAVNLVSLTNPALRRCLRKSRWVIAKTRETAAWIARAGGSATVSLEIGISPERIASSSRSPVSGRLSCLYAGRLIGLKGVHLALVAVARAAAAGVDISFTVVGSGPLRASLQALADALGIASRVSFCGQLSQEELQATYREHDLLLFPSLHDSSGNVVLEAFASGLPVLCLQLGGPAEMVDASCGRAVAARSSSQNAVIESLAASLLDFAGSPELLLRLRQGAREKAVAASWDDTVATVYAPVEAQLGRTAKMSRSAPLEQAFSFDELSAIAGRELGGVGACGRRVRGDDR